MKFSPSRGLSGSSVRWGGCKVELLCGRNEFMGKWQLVLFSWGQVTDFIPLKYASVLLFSAKDRIVLELCPFYSLS